MGQYFCRLCESGNGWVKPSQFATEKTNSHFARYGFAYEEWNFNPRLNSDDYQHGWLQAFTSNAVTQGKHDVALYVWRDRAAWLVGRIWDCENTSGTDVRQRYPAEFTKDLLGVRGLTVSVDGYHWNIRRTAKANAVPEAYRGEPLTNIRFKLNTWECLKTPIKTDIKYTRYGPLRVDECKNEKDKNQRQAIWQQLFPDRVCFSGVGNPVS